MYWKQWLQTLLGLVILLCVLEMLLPSGEMAKFSKLVLGLALMLAVLQPLSILLNQDLYYMDLAWQDALSSEPDVQRLAERVQLAATVPFLKNNEEAVEKQIEDILLSLDDIDHASVQILGAGQRDAPVHIWMRPFSTANAKVVRELVGSILNIPADQILVKLWAE
ncbi:MAG TPA: stage III sporulation protein AF [Limnochordia bacterium]|nr:stage III sporulation protein AF [Limnochordia bacterium]